MKLPRGIVILALFDWVVEADRVDARCARLPSGTGSSGCRVRSRRTGGPDAGRSRARAATAGRLATDINIARMRKLIQPVGDQGAHAGIHKRQAGASFGPGG